MKRLFTIMLSLVFCSAVFGQQTKQDYLKKSRSQKTAGTIILVGGSVMAVTGLGITLGNLNGLFDPNQPEPENNGKLADVLGYSGLVIVAGSIPFFIISSKNRKKAVSMSIKNQMIPQLQNTDFVYQAIPSLSFKINL